MKLAVVYLDSFTFISLHLTAWFLFEIAEANVSVSQVLLIITGSVSLSLDKLLRVHRLQPARDVVSLSPNPSCAFSPPLSLCRDTSGPGLRHKWGIIISSQCISGCLSP